MTQEELIEIAAALGEERDQLRRELKDTRAGLSACNKVLQEERAEIERLTTILRKAGVTGAPGPTGEWLPDEADAEGGK